MTNEQEREAFETWADDQGYALARTESMGGTAYTDLRTEGAWWVWQARAALAATPAAAELAKAHEARRQAQSELAYVKARLAGARLTLMRELKEQGWRPTHTPLTREQIDKIMTKHFPLDSMLRENVDAFEACVRDVERELGIGQGEESRND